MKAHRARRDSSEREITDVLTARGYSWRKIAQRGLPDLLVWKHYYDEPTTTTLPSTGIWLIEAKTGKGKLRATQDWAKVGLNVTVLRSAEEAIRWNR